MLSLDSAGWGLPASLENHSYFCVLYSAGLEGLALFSWINTSPSRDLLRPELLLGFAP